MAGSPAVTICSGRWPVDGIDRLVEETDAVARFGAPLRMQSEVLCRIP